MQPKARGGCGIDIDPKYIDVAVLTRQRFSGQQAVLEGDGRSFDEVAHERRPEATGDE
jgi:hypothetical protein